MGGEVLTATGSGNRPLGMMLKIVSNIGMVHRLYSGSVSKKTF